MTITEVLNIPKCMSFTEYEKLLEEKKKLEKQIAKASDIIQSENGSLEVLADEVGSDRHNKHLQTRQKAEIKRKKAQAKLKDIIGKLKAE